MVWKNKVVIVTGGGSGIGEAVCRRFAKEGAAVIVVDLNASKGESVAQSIVEIGGEALAIQGDVSAEADVHRIIKDVKEQFGQIDVLVNNAAVCSQVKLENMSLDQWNLVINTNLTSVFLWCRGVIPVMLENGGGNVVNVSSVHALATLDGYSAYAASKGGIVALTRAIALDYAKQNIRVNTVLPGAVLTPMLTSSVKNLDTPRADIMKAWNESQPIGRVGQPDEVAAAVVFAASPDNSFMTGASLVVDGGLTIDL